MVKHGTNSQNSVLLLSITCGLIAFIFQDYKGQYLSEMLYFVITILFGVCRVEHYIMLQFYILVAIY